MPQKKDWSTIQIREDVKNNLLELYNNDKKDQANSQKIMGLISFADPFSISSFFVPSINSDIFPDVLSLIDSLFP